MRGLFSKIKGMHLFLKIALANIFIVATIILIVASIVISSFSEMLFEKENLLGKEAIKKIQVYIEEKYNNAYNLTNLMHTSNNVSSYLSKITSQPDLAYDYAFIRFIDNYLLNVVTADPDICEYILITGHNNVYTSPIRNSRTVSPSFDYLNYTPVKDLLSSDSSMQITFDAAPEYIRNNEYPVVSFLGKIYDPSLFPEKQIVGIYIMNIPVHRIQNSYQDLAQTIKGELYVINKEDMILFSSNSGSEGKYYDSIAKEEAVSTNHASVGLSGIKVINIVPDSILYSEINQIRFQMVLVFVSSIFLATVLLFFLLNVYHKKIVFIAKQMQSIKGEDLNTRLPVKSDDEIGMLSASFNNMCQQLDNYIKLNYYAEMKLRTAELNALQAQINPHFLFNTIESIRMKALNDKNPEVAQMLSLLGNMFRWNIRFNEKIVYLEDEIDYISSYLSLQQFRFKDQIEIEISVPDELLNYGIPKLVLQPIVENAISHGICAEENTGLVKIAATYSDSDLLIYVSDNGCGMSEMKLIELQNNMTGKSNGNSWGIGLKNVHERIQLLFGKDYGLTVNSQLHQGTIVLVRIPCIKKEEMQKIV